MKFSESWLRTLVNPALSSEALSHLLTMAGLEVEEETPAAPAFHSVVVAQVLTVTRHENADRLNVCAVDVGEAQPLQIVCGAPNVAPGLKVPCARIGAELPGDFKIRQAKVRGVESFGMLCSAKELGLAAEAEGLWVLPEEAPVGTSLREYFNLDDVLLTLKLTPNRADCLSLQGIARDVAALTGAALSLPETTAIESEVADVLPIRVSAPEACPRYCGRVIRGVNAAAPTPDWMRQRLERSGLRSISALVDITNYVLLELGQPLHAFDLQRLHGGIEVRFARAGETLALLNDKTVELKPEWLVIADQQAPLALAGIMGGAASAVDEHTTDVFLESAFFTPSVILGRSRELGFGSDSSHRFERGVDFANTRAALERATALILDLCGGQPAPVSEVTQGLPARPAVNLRVARANRVLGLSLAQSEMQGIFQRLGFAVEASEGALCVTPPSFRFDIEIEEDLIEELARVVGYDAIPASLPARSSGMLPVSETLRSKRAIAEQIAAREYQEVINYAFVEEGWEHTLSGNPDPVKLLNPIASQMSVMRSSLFGGLLQNLASNLARKQPRVRLFEMGRVFKKTTEGFAQPERLGLLAWGPRHAEQWSLPAEKLDFFDLKGDVEALLQGLAVRFEVADQHPALHPGRAARVLLNDVELGFIGELHPRWVQSHGLPSAPQLAELDLTLLRQARLPKAGELSRFQSVRRDIAVVLAEAVPVQAVLDELLAVAGPTVRAVKLFDLYRGRGVADGHKSLAFAITLQDTAKTLTDEEIESEIAKLIKALEDKFNAVLRN